MSLDNTSRLSELADRQRADLKPLLEEELWMLFAETEENRSDSCSVDLVARMAAELLVLREAQRWIAFDVKRPEDQQSVFLAWRWRGSDIWFYAYAMFIDDEDGYYFAHVRGCDEWVLEEDLDKAEFYWQPETIPTTPKEENEQ